MGRPPLAGRQSPLALPQLGRQSPSSIGSNGRQSPMLMQKSYPKSTNSPLMRRVRKSSTNPPSSLIRKSISMDNVAVNNAQSAGKLIDTCEKYLSEKTDESAELVEEEECAVTADFDKLRNPEANSKESGTEKKFNEVAAHVDGTFSASYGTLPRSVSRSRNISRSLVPKMRKFFEKSRSCDPDLPQVKITIPNDSKNGNMKASHGPADGTESARSSFVMLSPGEASRSPTGSTMTLSDASDERSHLHGKNKGFVNKCVTKVRSLMAKSQERE